MNDAEDLRRQVLLGLARNSIEMITEAIYNVIKSGSQSRNPVTRDNYEITIGLHDREKVEALESVIWDLLTDAMEHG